MIAFERFLIGTIIVILLIVAWTLAQGIGQTLGGGLAEWLVR